jgi:hypothetical protein
MPKYVGEYVVHAKKWQLEKLNSFMRSQHHVNGFIDYKGGKVTFRIIYAQELESLQWACNNLFDRPVRYEQV